MIDAETEKIKLLSSGAGLAFIMISGTDITTCRDNSGLYLVIKEKEVCQC